MKIRLSALHCSLALLLCCLSPNLFAAQWHVKPSSEVPIRRGQGTEYKIVTVVTSGTRVSLVGVDGDWANVQLANGKEGWILKRYLSDQQPLQDQILGLEQNKKQLADDLVETDAHLTELLQVHSQTEQDLTVCVSERTTVNDDYQRLQQETADVVQTKSKLTATEKQLGTMSGRLNDLQLENTELQKTTSLIWFLAGAGVLFTGLLIGFLFGKRNKKRQNSLL